jgi:hypothetical protein
MVKERRLPLRAVVAFRAAGDIVLGELFAVNICMAVLTLRGRRLEIHIHQFGFQVRRFVTVDASCRSMRSKEWELRLRMIKSR